MWCVRICTVQRLISEQWRAMSIVTREGPEQHCKDAAPTEGMLQKMQV